MELTIPADAHEAIVRHARWCVPDEACGLLAGRPGEVRMVYPLTNIRASSTSYTIDPEGHFRALLHAERNGWEMIGAFHSHPSSDPFPSPTDVRLAAEPDWFWVIVGLRAEPDLRAFRIRGGGFDEIAIVTA